MVRIWCSVIIVFLPVIHLFHSPITFASTLEYAETIQMDNFVQDIASDGSHLIILYGDWPKDKILISDLSGNIIQSFDALGAFTAGLTFNGSRNKIIFSGGNNYDGLLHEMNPSSGAISGPLAYAGYIQPYLANDGSNILASGAAYGSNGVLTIPVTKLDANSYANHGSVSVTMDTGTQASGVSRSIIIWHKGNLYTALGIGGLNRVYEFDASLKLLGEIIISQVGPGQGIGGLTFIKDDLFVFNSSTDELYRYSPIGPDLTGAWTTPLTQACRTIGKNQRCSLKGTFTVSNIGNRDASSTNVTIYLSDDTTHEDGDTQLKSVATGKLKPGKSKAINVNLNLATNKNASGNYIIAVIDKDNLVTEIDETNNIIVAGPIQ